VRIWPFSARELWSWASESIVEGVAPIHKGSGDFADGLIGQPFHVVDSEGLDGADGIIEEVRKGPVEKDVVVGLAALEDGLDAGDVAVEGAEVIPTTCFAD